MQASCMDDASVLISPIAVGLVTVHAIDVVETLDGADVICPGTSLNAAESMVCSATYLVTQVSVSIWQCPD